MREAVPRFDADALDGLRDRAKAGHPPTLTEGEQAVLVNTILRGPDIDRDGGSEWSLSLLCRWIEGRFGKQLHPAHLSRIVHGLDLSRQET